LIFFCFLFLFFSDFFFLFCCVVVDFFLLCVFVLYFVIFTAARDGGRGLHRHVGLHVHPVQAHNPFLALVALKTPLVFQVLAYGYATLWFTNTFLAASLVTSLLTIVAYRTRATRARALPPYPSPDTRPAPMVCSARHISPGHRVDLRADMAHDSSARTLHGVMILGAVGSGKTSACMYPYVRQLLRWRAWIRRRDRRLVLEVKGDFCSQVRGILAAANRESDYLEIGLNAGVCYNRCTTISIRTRRVRDQQSAQQPVR